MGNKCCAPQPKTDYPTQNKIYEKTANRTVQRGDT